MSEGVPPAGVRAVMGLAFAAAGALPILAAFDIGPLHSRDIHGPPWLGVAAGGVFVMGAVFLWLYDATIRMPWLATLLALILLAGFAAIANWIAFGVGTRECSGDTIVGWFTSSRVAGEIECRAAFGIGALLVNGMIVWLAGVGLRQMGVPGRFPNALEKIGQWIIILALAPLFLVAIVAMLAKSRYDAWVR